MIITFDYIDSRDNLLLFGVTLNGKWRVLCGDSIYEYPGEHTILDEVE